MFGRKSQGGRRDGQGQQNKRKDEDREAVFSKVQEGKRRSKEKRETTVLIGGMDEETRRAKEKRGFKHWKGGGPEASDWRLERTGKLCPRILILSRQLRSPGTAC